MMPVTIQTVTSEVNESIFSFSKRVHTTLVNLGPLSLQWATVQHILFSNRIPVIEVSFGYKKPGPVLHGAELISAPDVNQLGSLSSQYVAQNKYRLLYALDVTPDLTPQLADRHLLIIYANDPWPTDSPLNNNPVFARALQVIPPQTFGMAAVVGYQYQSTSAPVYNVGPYTWKPLEDAIVYYEPQLDRLQAYPGGCNA